MRIAFFFVSLFSVLLSTYQAFALDRQAQQFSLAKVPLHFEKNIGQAQAGIDYLARSDRHVFFLQPGRMIIGLEEGRKGEAESELPRPGKLDTPAISRTNILQIDLLNSNKNAHSQALEESAGKSNYIKGKDPQKWITGVSHFRRVKYREVYPKIDIEYYGTGRQLEYDFRIGPRGDVSQIKLEFSGAKQLVLNKSGDLEIHGEFGKLVKNKPIAFQEIAGQRQDVPVEFVLSEKNRVSFKVGEYDRSRELVIDPVFEYFTYLGGSLGDYVTGLAVDVSGNAYVTSLTNSADFPMRNAINDTFASLTYDAAVSKINPAGSGLLYSTFIGGSSTEAPTALTVDASGNAYIIGLTLSADFPTINGYDSTPGGLNRDGFLVKLSPTGSLVYGTYLGNSTSDWVESLPTAIAIDEQGRTYITGWTAARNNQQFPLLNAFDSSNPLGNTGAGGFPGGVDAFILAFNASGTQVRFASFLGGDPMAEYNTGDEINAEIGITPDGNIIWIAGDTESPTLPITTGPAGNGLSPDNVDSEVYEAFVGKITVSGDIPTLEFLRYYGGSGSEGVGSLAVTETGHAYVVGTTDSADFPIVNAFQPMKQAGSDGFIAKFNVDINTIPNNITYSTFFGGSGADRVTGAILSKAEALWITGHASDIQTVNPLNPIPTGSLFVSSFSEDGGTLLFSTYTSGGILNSATNKPIGLDHAGGVYIAGEAIAGGLATPGAFDEILAQNDSDGFVAKLHHLAEPDSGDTCTGNCLFSIGKLNANGGLDNRTTNYEFCHAQRLACAGMAGFQGSEQDPLIFYTPLLPKDTAVPLAIMPGYLYGHAWPPDNFEDDQRPAPNVTKEFSVIFNTTDTTDPSDNDYCVLVYLWGSETNKVKYCMASLLDPTTCVTPEQSAPWTGMGEDKLKRGVLTITNYTDPGVLKVSIEHLGLTGKNNGNYIELIQGRKNCNSDGFAAATLGGTKNAIDPRGAKLWQLGFENSNIPESGFGANNEFNVTSGHTAVYNYDVTNNPDPESQSPALPGVLSSSAALNHGSTERLNLNFSLPQTYLETTLYVSFYGTTPLEVLQNGVLVGQTNSLANSSRQLAIVSLKKFNAGQNQISLKSSGPLIIDYISLIDTSQADVDADGLPDAKEGSHGTKLQNPDSDADGVLDGAEVQIGSDPLDPGSALRIIGKDFCVESNSFLGMYNVFETRNNADFPRAVEATLYGIDGQNLGRFQYTIAPQGQYDLLLHSFSGWQADRTGNLCLQQLDGEVGDLSGLMAYYRPTRDGSGNFDFAFGLWPQEIPANLQQVVPVNTFHPGLRSVDRGKLVANWIQVSRPRSSSTNTVRGEVKLVDINGSELRRFAVSLRAGQRLDLPGHEIGGDRVGMAVWKPRDIVGGGRLYEEKITLRNARYYFGAGDSFDSAFQLAGQVGTGEILVAPVDTRRASSIVELLNTLSEQTQTVTLSFYNSSHTLVQKSEHVLPPFGSLHVIVDGIKGMENQLGSVVIDPLRPEGTSAVVMQYGRNTDLGLSYAYGISAREPLAQEFHGTYNSFLQQGCRLVLVNGHNQSLVAEISAFALDGTLLPLGERGGESAQLSLRPFAATEFNLCRHVPLDSYGSVAITSSRAKALFPLVIRDGKNDSYRFPGVVE